MAEYCLWKDLEHPDDEIRLETLEKLLKQPSAGTVELIVPLLHDANQTIQLLSIKLLGKIGRAAHSTAFLDLLTTTKEPNLQLQIVKTLQKIGSPELVPPLLDLFLNFPQDDHLLNAAENLISSLITPGHIPLITDLVEHPDPNVKRRIIPLLSRLLNQFRIRRLENYLIELLEDVDEEVCLAALDGLATLDWSSFAFFSFLDKSLSSPYQSVQLAALDTLATIQDERSVPAIIQLLDSDDPVIVCSTITALGRIGSNRATGSLKALLKRGVFEPEILQEFQLIGDPCCAEAVLPYLAHENHECREWAATIMGTLLDLSAVTQLIRLLLEDPFIGVRQASAHTLGELGHISAAPALMTAVEHDVLPVKKVAMSALVKMGSVVQWTDEALGVIRNGPFSLRKYGLTTDEY